ncbi:PREDICTED: DNA dC-_dU-editing enzyme APOBEC-3G-like [Gekko japonicus]|uniref:DNA dC->dU-editing enzyme APOBEC-3G-like n=1 Tax=Gekko japonicus TaxID=146911 RepID=A0ABM1KFT9_GEKJA|nr:PREDICTED: DNA dC->dU-editing enzyme APOBEC-3G-like [Gekko japonicus]
MEPQLQEERGQAGGNHQRWRIESETFQRNYTPTEPPEVTHLLYVIHWDGSRKTWKQWCTNNFAQHAEINFLENACEVINRQRTKPCSVTWFLSWSPCGRCSHSIIQFLEEHPNITLDIRFSQLFRYSDWRNQNGLRALANHGVKISVMQLPDYAYCWRTFVLHQRRNRNYWPLNFIPLIRYYSQQLYSILEALYRAALINSSILFLTGQLAKDTDKRWRIEPDDFEKNYTPESRPHVTYLLYEIHWGKSLRTWKNWCKNDVNRHAEINFFETACEEIKRRTKPCYVTWFLSWSPCHNCSKSIIEFLGKHPNVTLDIRVSRLFRDWDENKTELRALAGHRGIHLSIMHPGDYSYCWKTFVAHQKNQGSSEEPKDYMHFFTKIHDWNAELCSVLKKHQHITASNLTVAGQLNRTQPASMAFWFPRN